MQHTIIYYGRYDLNYQRLLDMKHHPQDFLRINAKGDTFPIDAPSDKVDGFVFGYMEKTGEAVPDNEHFWAVKVEHIVLDRPVNLDIERHTEGKRFGPSSSLFGDASAKRLLDDILSANPGRSAALSALRQRFFGPIQGHFFP